MVSCRCIARLGAGGAVWRATRVIFVTAVSFSVPALSYAQARPIEVHVTGEHAPAVGSRAREPLRDVPATVNVVTGRELEERATADVQSALSWVPGLSPQLTYGAFTAMTLRGFDDFVTLVDGMRDDRYTVVQSAPTGNLAGIDRIEVLKGPASALYGYGGIGGVVSYHYKRPSRQIGYEGSLTLGGPTWLRRAAVGATGPLGETFAFRADAGLVDDEDFRGARSANASARGTLEWRPTPEHTLIARGAFQKLHFTTDTGLPTQAGRVPEGILLDRRFNTPWDYLDAEVYDARLDYAYTPAGWITLAVRAGASRNPYSYKSAEFLAVGPGETVERQWFFLDHDWKPLSLQVEVQARGRLLVPHRALVGYELGFLASEHPRANLDATDLAPVPFRDAPDPQGDYAVLIDMWRRRRQTTHAIYAHDTFALLPGMKLSLTARFDDFEYEERNSARGADGAITATPTFTRGAAAFTFRSGFVLQPAIWLTFYGVAGTAFRPVRVVPTDGRALDPERGRQVEVGARIDAFDGRMHVDLAGYNLRKTDIVVGRGGGIYEQAGAQSSRGVEASLSLERIGGLALRAGYAYTLARFDTYLSADGDFTGRTPSGVPDHMVTAWGTYRVAHGLGVGAGLRAVGQSWADPANRVAMPAYAVVDAALYTTHGPLELTLNVSNLFGLERYFVSTINDTQLTPGAPRTVLATVRFRP